MSADNGVYILHTKDGYRVKHAQCIENIYYWYICCANPDVQEYNIDDDYYHEQCLNCKTDNPPIEQRDVICPDRLLEIFDNCIVLETHREAYTEALKIYNEIANDSFCGICEYGICEINATDIIFPGEKYNGRK